MNKLVPELRISEFKDYWEIKKLRDLVHYENGKAHEKDIVENGSYIVVNSKFISSDGQVLKYTNNANLLASKNDILMVLSDVPNGRAIAKCLHVDEDNTYTVNQRICKLRTKGVNSKYLYYLLNRNKYFLDFDDGVKQTNLKKDDVLNCPLPIPNSAEEQLKVADFLTSLDCLILANVKKMELLISHKTGLMQSIFPEEGKTVPEFRFSRFYNDWKKKPLSKLFTIGSGKDHKHLGDGDIPVYGSGGYMRSVNDYLYEGKSACIGRKGTINRPMLLEGKFWTVDTLFYTHSFKNCIPEFVYLLFQNIDWLKLNEAGGVPSLSKVIINKIEVLVPEVEEQQKIVDCIFSVDSLIKSQSYKIELLELYKKGLMQRLFPNFKGCDK
ncbi:restriction endonuclease subunit S [Vibrio alginolyticus]|uniref:restriction endonuclease subunit S n=1 Tax=Vibrio alginolyticus TaxID=663 RepID=UPI001303D19B|nr:restriction endonuclease subunit S [Vibrio alginolyticus]